MILYIAIATNSHTFAPIVFTANNVTEARHWVSCHLACDLSWHIMEVSSGHVSNLLTDPTSDGTDV